MTAYKAQAGSPLIDSGMNISSGALDFFGTTVWKGATTDIGVHETISVVQPVTRIVSPAITNRVLSFSVTGPVGMTNTIQISTNLSSWSTLTTFVNTNGTFRFSESIGTGQARRFYRIQHL
jgi:hypothetical protein